jgi:hypothetical protein
VEVVYAPPGRPFIAELRLPAGSTVADAIAASEVVRRFPELADDLADRVGVFGRPVSLDRVLVPHDRVEIYRALVVTPKEARRLRARRRRQR